MLCNSHIFNVSSNIDNDIYSDSWRALAWGIYTQFYMWTCVQFKHAINNQCQYKMSQKWIYTKWGHCDSNVHGNSKYNVKIEFKVDFKFGHKGTDVLAYETRISASTSGDGKLSYTPM